MKLVNQSSKNDKYSIRYVCAIEESFDAWAESCRMSADELRKATADAIHDRMHEAYISHPSERANGKEPNIFTLSLGWASMIFTIESDTVCVRGYHWPIDHEPLDDFDGGAFYLDNSWLELPEMFAK